MINQPSTSPSSSGASVEGRRAEGKAFLTTPRWKRGALGVLTVASAACGSTGGTTGGTQDGALPSLDAGHGTDTGGRKQGDASVRDSGHDVMNGHDVFVAPEAAGGGLDAIGPDGEPFRTIEPKKPSGTDPGS